MRVAVLITATACLILVLLQRASDYDDPAYLQNADGWPRILSRLKTLLETGKTFRPH